MIEFAIGVLIGGVGALVVLWLMLVFGGYGPRF